MDHPGSGRGFGGSGPPEIGLPGLGLPPPGGLGSAAHTCKHAPIIICTHARRECMHACTRNPGTLENAALSSFHDIWVWWQPWQQQGIWQAVAHRRKRNREFSRHRQDRTLRFWGATCPLQKNRGFERFAETRNRVSVWRRRVGQSHIVMAYIVMAAR